MKVPLPREAGSFVLEGDEEVDIDDEEQEMQIESECSGGQCDDEIQRTHLLDYKVKNSILETNIVNGLFPRLCMIQGFLQSLIKMRICLRKD